MQRQKAAQHRTQIEAFWSRKLHQTAKTMSEKGPMPTCCDHKAETDRWSRPTVNKLICLNFSGMKGIILGSAEL